MALCDEETPGRNVVEGGAVSKRVVLVVSAITAFLSPFMISAVNIALPAIQEEFSAGAILLSWVAAANLLATAIFLVPAGKVGDMYGRKRVLALGLGLFTLATVGAGAAPSMALFLSFRALQGVGGAFMLTSGMAILSSVFPPGERGKALGINVAAVYTGASAGPFLGGWLVHQLGWRGIFLANAAVGVFALLLIFRFIRAEWVETQNRRIDVRGGFIYGCALVCLMLGTSRLPSWNGTLLALTGAVFLVLFVRRMRAAEDPLFDVRLFEANRVFAFSNLAALVNYAATFSVAFLLSLYLQYIKGMSSGEAGLILVVQPVLQAICSPLSGRLSDRVEPRVLASSGMGLTVLGLGLLIFLGRNTSLTYVSASLALLGVGFGLFSSPNMNAIMGSVESRHYGIASGSVATMRLLGQMLSMTVTAMTFAMLLGHGDIDPSRYDAFLRSVRICFTASAFFCSVGIWFSLSRGTLHHGRLE
jgi:EmrB/QacA subfamily drug resistance transporter